MKKNDEISFTVSIVGAPKNTTKFILIPMQVAVGFLQPPLALKKDSRSALNHH
jgi:hypothetical protein